MLGTILVYGNDEILATTRRLVLERAGYEVFFATAFASAMLILINERIDVLLVCQSLSAEEQRGILETAHSINPNIKCAVFGCDGREVAVGGVEVFLETLQGPPTLLKAIGRILQG